MATRWISRQWLGVLFSVLSACGGESRNEADNPEPENPEPESSALECTEVRDQSLAILMEAETNAPAECRSASDCRLFTGNTKCVYGCGWAVATTDEAPLQDAVDEANALCRDECRQPPPPCVPTKNVADCVSGKCVVVDELHREDCDAVRSRSMTLLSDAVANAPLACDSSSDCLMFAKRPRCVYDCGFSAATTDLAPLESAAAEVDALCRDECVQVPSSCGGRDPSRSPIA